MDSRQKPNFENLVKFIKGHKYYYYKAIFFAIIKTLLIIMQLISSIIIFYPKNGFFNRTFEIISFGFDLELGSILNFIVNKSLLYLSSPA